jgi:murein DD-endopeptidase MepM/ murein hydrolase activator NlpD
MTTPFGTSSTNPGAPHQGAWSEQTGNATLSSVDIVLEKTRVSFETDWLFIGEIEIYGEASGSYRPAFDLPISYPNRGARSETDFVAAWQRCATSFFDHNLPGQKGTAGDGLLWLWTGDAIPGAQATCGLFQNCYDGHEGTDFDDVACYGTAVFPAAPGEIVASETGWADDGYGNRVVIQHGASGYKSLYGHLERVMLSSGSVDATTQIGEIGATGCPGCGTHLHFNVYYHGQLVDPSGWEGHTPDPNATQNGATSFRQWLYPVARRTTIGHATGTTLVAPSGNTVVYLPPNAHDLDFELSVTELAPLGLAGPLQSAGHGVSLSGRDNRGSIGQLGMNFTVVVRFSASDIASVNPSTLSLYLWNALQGEWTKLPTQLVMPAVEQAAIAAVYSGSATAQTSALGYIALLAEAPHTLRLPVIIR